MGTVKKIVRKPTVLGEMGFEKGGGNIEKGVGNINWFPGHMAAATRAIRDRLKLSDLIIEVRDARIPLSSANEDLQPVLSGKRCVIALNKKDLANPNIMHRWIHYFDSPKQDCLYINAHSNSSVKKDITTEVQRALCTTLLEFNGNLEDEVDLGSLVDQQFQVLQKALRYLTKHQRLVL